jgi:anti-sigma factor RsiW
MISTRRTAAAVGLAVGVTGLVAPMANAADAPAFKDGKVSPVALLDSLAVSEIPAEHQAQLPKVADQMKALNHLNDLQQLHQVTDMAAPVTGLLPAVE